MATHPNLILRRAALHDARFLFILRNEPSVRAVSFSTGDISYRSHERWLQNKLGSERVLLLIVEVGGTAVGQARFDAVSPDEAEVSVSLIPAARGKGLGEPLIRRASLECFRVFPRILRIRARIKTDNPASLWSFEKAGYAACGEGAVGPKGYRALVLYRTHQRAAPEVLRIGARLIGAGHPCFVVAELSGNHRQSYDQAVALLKAAQKAGADAVKLQTYTADTMTLNSDKRWFRVGGKGNPANWKGKTIYQLYRESYTPWEWQPKLKRLADKLGIILFSTPFDETAVDFLEKMDVSCYKVASYEATDFVLLRRVAQTRKPVILSVGYASEDEIQFAIDTLRTHGTKEIAVLHCVTGYAEKPTAEDMRLSNIADLQKRFRVVSGFSDNNAGIGAPLMAVASGASIIEKHLTLERDKGGPDARFSLEPGELAELISRIRALESGAKKVVVPRAVFGTPRYGPMSQIEVYNKRWRRSLFSGRDIQKGDMFTKENVRDVRPAFGLPTRYIDDVIGKRAARDIAFATPLSWEMIQ